MAPNLYGAAKAFEEQDGPNTPRKQETLAEQLDIIAKKLGEMESLVKQLREVLNGPAHENDQKEVEEQPHSISGIVLSIRSRAMRLHDVLIQISRQVS